MHGATSWSSQSARQRLDDVVATVAVGRPARLYGKTDVAMRRHIPDMQCYLFLSLYWEKQSALLLVRGVTLVERFFPTHAC